MTLCFWRTPYFPAALAAILAVLAVPIFLRLPLWCDVTLYDVAARAILGGGVHYRDVFDTNTPGFVWCLTALRAALGPSTIAVRAVDLGIFAGVVFLLDRLAKLGGGSAASRWWAIAGMVSFYPFSTEFIHAQRDVWLALPMLAAVYLRLKRMGRMAVGAAAGLFWPAFAEGLCWAIATWIKPHVIPLALATWLLTVRRLSGGSWRIAGRDLAGNLGAGIALGLAGLALLVGSGSWPHFWDVMTNWNGHYTDLIFSELIDRLPDMLSWFPPWSVLLIPSSMLVVLSLFDARVLSPRWLSDGARGPIGREVSGYLYDPAPSDATRYCRAVLAWVYIVWALESFVLQRAFLYVHVTETLLMMALWASHRWCLPGFVLVWIASLSVLFRIADGEPPLKENLRGIRLFSYDKLEYDYRHPLSQHRFGQDWRAAIRTPTAGPDDARLKDKLKKFHGHVATSHWEELGEVEAYLRSQGVKDRELVCWDEGVHPLYLALGVKPGLRFMHIHTAERIGEDAALKIRGELKANPEVRFVVSDLEWVAFQESESRYRSVAYRPGRSPDNLVPEMPEVVGGGEVKWSEVFPYDGRKAVFRSNGGHGRYIVFAVSTPLWRK